MADAALTSSWVRGLRLVLTLDGTGVAGLVIAALATRSAELGALAAVAGLSWALALLTLPPAMRRPGGFDLRRARLAVVTGALLNTLGSGSLTSGPPGVAATALAVLLAGAAVSVGYLLLLARPARSG